MLQPKSDAIKYLRDSIRGVHYDEAYSVETGIVQPSVIL